MTTETKKRIRAYKRMLPELRERVVAVALLLAMSVSMLGSASFAWLTISRRPEVTGVNTTVAANGNLEIALATGTTTNAITPNESQVGDSSAAEGQSVTAANITWGNLVNLSDPSYGLDKLALRPAQLNRSALLVSPLYGAVYKDDGRVSELNSSFGFASWGTDKYGTENFYISDKIGVRAISSVTVEAAGEAQNAFAMRENVASANLAAGSAYLSITQNNSYMTTLSTVMGTYMTAKMNAGQGDESLTNPTISSKDVQNLRDLFADFINVYDLQYAAMAKLVNYQLYLKNNSPAGSTDYTEKTEEDIKATSEANLKKEGLQVSGLNTAKSDYAKLLDGYEKLKNLAEQGSVKWADSGLNNIVNNLMNVGTCTLDGTPINNIGVSNATGYLDGKTHNATITNGVLYNFERLNGSHCDVRNLSVSAKVKRMGITIPASIKANITTNAPVPHLFYSDLVHSDTLNQGFKGTEVAQDTYGLALDLWVRTNAANSYLTLEGNVLTTSEMVRATGIDINGNPVDIYTLKRTETIQDETTGEETEADYEFDLYQLVTTDESGTEVTNWYNAVNHTIFTLNDGENPIPKMVEVVTVVGYEGENRIWEDANAWEENSQLSLDSTTQGSGSCYVYYADTPEDQARSLELLDAMYVAFVGADGTLLAEAEMDTEHFYAENGRVTVPLVLRTNSDSLTDASGNTIYTITPLEQNVPKQITAIMYLDGTTLNNQNVLAASEIQGRLNIQFGSSIGLQHAKDETLLNAVRTVSASVSQTYFDYDDALATNTPMTTRVTVNVDGDEAQQVTAFFLRAISSTQGSREEEMTFTKQADSSWAADYTFTGPGNYVLRSVELDGQTYDLDECPTVQVEGFAIKSLSQSSQQGTQTGNHISIMTADSAFAVNLELQFEADNQAAMPSTVQGRYLRQDGTAVNVNFVYNANSNTWNGRANFISSGEYNLQYLVLDGEYTALNENLWKSASVKLGMKVAVYTDSPSEFLYLPGQLADNEENLYINVSIMDNTGAELQGLQGTHLYYTLQGSDLAERGMDAPLVWNGTTGYYECDFRSKVGVYNFNRVTVGNSTITYAETSPTFRIMSADPPALIRIGADKGGTFFQQNKDAYMTATLENSATATIMALIRKDIKDSTGKVTSTAKYYVMAENPTNIDAETSEWKFYLPNNEAQDGYWTMEELYVWDYYTPEGNLVTTTLKKQDGSGWDRSTTKWIRMNDLDFTDANTCLRINMAEENYWKKIIQTVNVSFTEDKSANFTGNAMLQPYTVSGLHVDFTDFQGQPVMDNNGSVIVSGVELVFEYVSGTSDDYGGYTSDKLNNATEGAVVRIPLTADESGSHFVQTADAQLLYAGKYKTTLNYKVGNSTASITATDADNRPKANMPMFTVSSERLTVKVTDVNPGTSTAFTTTKVDGNNVIMVPNVYNYISETGDSAVVYLKGTQSGWGYWSYSVPTVTLKLTGLAAPSETIGNKEMLASLTMVNQANTNIHHIFNFTTGDMDGSGSMTSSSDVGKSISNSNAHDTKQLAGKTTFETVPVTYDGITYTATLANAVTINQPESPYIISFEQIPDMVEDKDKPTMIVTQGGNVQITLPTLSYVERTEVDATYSDWTEYQKDALIRTDYSTRNYKPWIGVGSWTQYTWYDWTRYISTRLAYGTFSCQKIVTSGWSINGEAPIVPGTYTISVSSDVVITPIFANSGAPYTETETEEQATTEKRYLYGYTKDSSHENVDTNTAGSGGYEIGNKTYTSITNLKEAPAPKLYPANSYATVDDYKKAWP